MHSRTNQLTGTPRQSRHGGRHLLWRAVAVAALGLMLGIPHPAQAKAFHSGAGDVPCLMAAITAANANGKKNTIRLAAGTYTLTDVDHTTDGPNGLPSITSTLTIRGAGAETTTIESMGAGRLVHVAASGRLTLRGLTLQGGRASSSSGAGGAILNHGGRLTLIHVTLDRNSAAFGGGLANVGGTVAIAETLFTQNGAQFGGGGLANLLPNSRPPGSVFITTTTFADNATIPAGGGLWNEGGIVTITQSAFLRNRAAVERGGGIRNGGTMFIRNTTLAGNITGGGGGGVASVVNATTMVMSSTVVGNTATGGVGGGGLEGEVIIENTLVALNMGSSLGPPDNCRGAVTSLGYNLIGDPTGCAITLQPTDLIGDPGLGDFADNGTPGHGHYPLLPSSQAIDAGNKATCPQRDQLGERRVGPCDIGAIEFQDQDDDQDDRHHGEASGATAQEPQ
jgi:hypothetical protein